MARIAAVLLSCLALAPAQPAGAFDFSGETWVTIETTDGETIPIGSVAFLKTANGASVALAVDHGRFKDFCLSMREFKCLEGKEILCHAPYPYPNPRSASSAELGCLEG
jgi:hypothetical protein